MTVDISARTAPSIGASASDEDLRGWRQAATSGGLPNPCRDRWQVLRSGVVNLWEFDVAEYWYADGRAQLVGANQSGKSTLMALTTLILLAGDLDRTLVDTFGQQHKSFRYYVEPTDDPADRRETDASTSRGWAWVEYGRLGSAGPEFFTTALFTRARRGQNDYVKKWITCAGDARVGDGLELHAGSAASEPKDLADVPGFHAATDAKEYRARVATTLFGFAGTDRLEAAVRMLKVLRTPHLGQKLDPSFFTDQMRQALPAVDSAEIEQLAEGWDQLDRLAADRDAAAAARGAVAGYVSKSFGPWADAVLLHAADELVGANTAFDRVTRDVRAAEERHRDAEDTSAALAGELEQTERAAQEAAAAHVTLLQSRAYTDARSATANVENLRDKAAAAAREVTATRGKRTGAMRQVNDLRSEHDGDRERHDKSVSAADDAAAAAAAAAADAGLPADAALWAQERDVTRLEAAAQGRRSDIRTARGLLRQAAIADRRAEELQKEEDRTDGEERTRTALAGAAEHLLTEQIQGLSDALERWAGTAPDAPDGALREGWLERVRAQVQHRTPQAVLRAAVRTDWLEPLTGPWQAQAGALRAAASSAREQARHVDEEADAVECQREPVPPAPVGWSRRVRPDAPGVAGGPLWRLVDPVEGTDARVVGHLEAALAAAGLLDAWVTPDGVWQADRDETDVVVRPAGHAPGGGRVTGDVRTLAAVLRVAGDAGTCTGTVQELLDRIGYAPEGADMTADCLSSDGRWQYALAAGRAVPGPDGPELLGTAARTEARGRRVAALRAQAEQLREQAGGYDDAAAAFERRVVAAARAATDAPSDDAVVRAATALRHARQELEDAQRLAAKAAAAAQDARVAAADATSALLTFTGPRNLPGTDQELDRAADAATAAAQAAATMGRLTERVVEARRVLERSAGHLATAADQLETLTQELADAEGRAAAAETAATVAAEALGRPEREILERAEALARQAKELEKQVKALNTDVKVHEAEVGKAQEALAQAGVRRSEVERTRDQALARWWVPVDHGLAGMRDLPEASGRLLTHAIAQAQAARRALRVPSWPEDPAGKEDRVRMAWSRLTGGALVELRAVLESSGGRTAHVVDAAEPGALGSVVVVVDSSGSPVNPTQAIDRLEEQVQALAASHDQQMQKVLWELLHSTFVDHLRDRLVSVIGLLHDVNLVLAAHPHGANAVTLRLRRIAADKHAEAFAVLASLERGSVEAEAVQEQVRAFLEQQIHLAQDAGRGGPRDWKDYLVEQLDYRSWFDVVTDYRVGDTGWRPLTKEVHAKDSGGGKVITLLQPLLATLVALYSQSSVAPRPLWLDEAFTGVDDGNRSAMLAMLVEFDLDFLLAGPAAMVAAAQVPAAAVWTITRAPAPDPGVDLGLMLWAGRTLETLTVVAPTLAGRSAAPAGPTLFDQADGEDGP